VRVTTDTDNAVHNVEVVGGTSGTAYVAWQTNAPAQGYATYLQTFSTSLGLLGTPELVSSAHPDQPGRRQCQQPPLQRVRRSDPVLTQLAGGPPTHGPPSGRRRDRPWR
jgi:hypothetical protein